MSSRTDPLQMVRTELPSGLATVIQAPPTSARTFSISYVAPAGWGFEPPGVEGLASVAAKLMVQMPGRRSKEELARTLDRLGATLTSAVAAESAEVTVWGPQDSWKRLLEIFGDAIFRPRFREEELARALRQLRERQLRQSVQPDLRAERDLLSAVFPLGHPYHSTGLGTARSAARITPSRLERFHSRHFPARGSVLAVTMRGTADSIVRSLAPHFPETDLRPDPSLPSLSEKRPKSSRLDIPIRGQSQVAIRMGGPSVSRSSPSYAALFLVNEVLGGRPLLSRLFQRIRERHGLAYHASSELESMRWAGYWEALAGTDPTTRDRVVDLMLKEIQSLSSDLIPASELDRLRESSLGSLPLELETAASAHQLAVDVAYHGLPGDFYRTWPARLRRLTSKDLRTAAETGFRSEGATVVTAGPAPA